MADVNVTMGSALPGPLMVITADPWRPTLYDVGDGVIDTTMYCPAG